MTQPATIAVVDDDLDIREALQGLIASLGYVALPFSSAEAFLAFPRRDVIDCMIVDVRMPGLSGVELQRALRAEHCGVPIIFMTSYVDDTTRRSALAGGAHRFLGKPVDDQVLIDSLEAALGHR